MKNKLKVIIAGLLMLISALVYAAIGRDPVGATVIYPTQKVTVYTVTMLSITKMNDFVYTANIFPSTDSTWISLGSSGYRIDGAADAELSVSGVGYWGQYGNAFDSCTPLALSNGTITTDTTTANTPFITCLHVSYSYYNSNSHIVGDDQNSITLSTPTAYYDSSKAYIYLEIYYRKSKLTFPFVGAPLTGTIPITITYNK